MQPSTPRAPQATAARAGARIRRWPALATGVVAGVRSTPGNRRSRVALVVQLRPGASDDACSGTGATRTTRARASGRRRRGQCRGEDRRPRRVHRHVRRRRFGRITCGSRTRALLISVVGVGIGPLGELGHERPAAVSSAHDRPRDWRTARAPGPGAARHGAELSRLAAGSRPPDAHEQPRSRGRRGSGRARRVRRHRPGGAELGGLRRDRPRAARASADDETLLVQSGKPVGVLRTHEWAPRVLIANSNLVGKWATWDVFRELERAGPDDVRPDDRGILDLHRDPGDPPGHVRDVRRAGPAALRRDAARAASC